MATSIYNHHRFARATLKKFRKAPPSFTIELFEDRWKFKDQDGSLDYDGPMRSFLEAIRSQTLPSSLLPHIISSDIRLYDGCLIVEIHDFRPPSSRVPRSSVSSRIEDSLGPVKGRGTDHFTRNTFSRGSGIGVIPASSGENGKAILNAVLTPLFRPPPNSSLPLSTPSSSSSLVPLARHRSLLRPDPTTLFTQLSIRNSQATPPFQWTDEGSLALEAAILVATAPPLLLDPTRSVATRVAGLAMTLTAPVRSCIASDGSFISRRQRRARAGLAEDDEEAEGEGKGTRKEKDRERDRFGMGLGMSVGTLGQQNGGVGMEDGEKIGIGDGGIKQMVLGGRDKFPTTQMPKHSQFDYISHHPGWRKMRNRPMAEDMMMRQGGMQQHAQSGPQQHQELPQGHVAMGYPNPHVNGGNEDTANGGGEGVNGTGLGVETDMSVPAPKKKPMKKKKTEEGGPGTPIAVPDDPKAKPKKKKTGPPIDTGSNKGKKRPADEMSDVGTANGSTANGGEPEFSIVDKKPTKKLTKKAREALAKEKADREASAQPLFGGSRAPINVDGESAAKKQKKNGSMGSPGDVMIVDPPPQFGGMQGHQQHNIDPNQHQYYNINPILQAQNPAVGQGQMQFPQQLQMPLQQPLQGGGSFMPQQNQYFNGSGMDQSQNGYMGMQQQQGFGGNQMQGYEMLEGIQMGDEGMVSRHPGQGGGSRAPPGA